MPSGPQIAPPDREALARKAAAREGLGLLKAYARNRLDPNFGLYLLADPRTNSIVFPPQGLFTTLDDIEEYLLSR